MADMSNVFPQTHDSLSAVTDISMPYTESGSSSASSSIRHFVKSSGREMRLSGSVIVVSRRSSAIVQQYMYRQLTKSLVSVQSRMITTRSCENLSPRLDTVSQSCHFTRCGGLFNKWSNNSDERLHRHLVTPHGSEWIRPTLMVRPISSCMVLWTHMNPTPNGISITSAKFC